MKKVGMKIARIATKSVTTAIILTVLNMII